jgi:endonuclease/exonuclease/phosphatase family metal-dependent hydrolase
MMFRVLALNIWGIPIAPDRDFRMRSISDEIASMELDFIGIEEGWLAEDRAYIIEGAHKGGLLYSSYFPSGVAGSGLLLISRYPIIESGFFRYSLSGEPQKINQGDYYGGKGVGFVRTNTPIGYVDLYVTHAIAQYASDQLDEYQAHRASAMYECARYINSQSDVNPILLLGDLNVRPDQREYKIIRSLGILRDCYHEIHPTEMGATISPENPYKPKEQPKRIDYVLTRSGKNVDVKVVNADVVMKLIRSENGTSEDKAYSDHFGVFVELEMIPSIERINDIPQNDALLVKEVLLELSDILNQELISSGHAKVNHISQVIAGLVSLPFLLFTQKKLMTRKQFLARVFWILASFVVLPYSIIQSWLSFLIFPEKINSLTAILDEIKVQIEAKRAFNGVTW